MYPLPSLLQPRPSVDRTAEHKSLIAAGVRNFVHGSGLGLLPQLPELLGDALRDPLGRSVLACVGDEYSHFCSLLEGRIHPPLCYFIILSEILGGKNVGTP